MPSDKGFRAKREELQDHISSIWQRAEKERKVLMLQVGFKHDMVSKASPKNILNDLTAKVSDFGTNVTNYKESSSSLDLSQGSLWSLDADGQPLPYPEDLPAGRRGESTSDSESNASTVDAASTQYRMKTLETMVLAHQDEIRELRALLAERDAALGKLQNRNSTLTSKLEEKEQQITGLESKLSKLNRRLREADAYGPPAWIVKDAVRGGYGLEAMGLMQNNSNTSMWHEDDLGVSEGRLVPGSEELESKLSEPSAAPILNMIECFSKALLLKKPKGSDYTMVHNFLGAVEGPIRSHQLWSNCEDNEIEDTMDAVERRILGDERLCASVLCNMGESWTELDADLDKRMWCLQFVQPQHLDIKRAHSHHPALTLARKTLVKVNSVHAPQEKLECIFRCARILFRLLNETAAVERAQAASADDFLPLFILTVLRSRAKNLHSIVEYISLFRRPSRLTGERHYYLVQLQTAITFIQHMDATSLTIEKSEFDQQLRAREAEWDSGKIDLSEAGSEDTLASPSPLAETTQAQRKVVGC